MRNVTEETAGTFGGLDILCANAGIFPQSKMADMDPSEWDHVMSVNLKSSFLCVKAAIPYFEKAGKGRVVVTSSITGPMTGFPGSREAGPTTARRRQDSSAFSRPPPWR